MKILVLTAEYPPSTRQPGSPRLYNICRELARQHALSLCLLKPSPERRDGFMQDNAADRVFGGISELPAYSNKRGPLLPWVLQRLRHRLVFAPNYSRRILAPDYVAQTRAAIKAAVEAQGIDLLYLDGIACFQYLPEGLRVRVAIDMCDCISWLVAQLSRREKSWLRRISLFFEARSVRAEERLALASTALQVAISPVDAEAFRAIHAQANLLVVQNGVDQEYFDYRLPAAGSRSLIFTGVMGYQPNSDAAAYLAEEIFPKVRQRCGEARLLLVGADPPEAVRRLAQQAGVTVTGAVPDVRPYLRDSAVFVCPLRIGAGVKNKLLAAMAMGVPVVANSLSMSGIAARAGEHLLAAETAEEFAARVGELFEDRACARRLSENGRHLVEAQYGWSAQAAVLEKALAKLVE